jgi:hypothetical protein
MMRSWAEVDAEDEHQQQGNGGHRPEGETEVIVEPEFHGAGGFTGLH